jgi:membrane-associated phospholipid phosphatase
VSVGTLDPELSSPNTAQPTRKLRWWRQVIFVLVFYAAYSVVRDIRGSQPVSTLQAFHNAARVIRVERFFGIFQEQRIQHLFLSYRGFVSFCDVFYGTAHFFVTVVVLVWLFYRQPERYPLWRNTLACTTALALIGFAFFPLMPPRLLPGHYHFVDTLKTIGGLWSFDSGPVSRLSNQYAAMPSLHFAWASWCAFVILPALKRRSAKLLVFVYPLVTLYCIVVTGNHYILDAVGGAIVLGAGLLLAAGLARIRETRRFHLPVSTRL